MSGGIVTKITGTLLLLILTFLRAFPQDEDIYPVQIMFYNAENLFDIFDDPLADDQEFLPDGVRRWTYKRYSQKINMLYKTILAAGKWEPPAIIGLCEVENHDVLRDLVSNTWLSKFNYGILHDDSPDPRGIDVCLIYRKSIVKILDYKYLIPTCKGTMSFKTRSVFYACLGVGSDTLNIFLNHWPSRRGGVLAAEEMRETIAMMVSLKADSIQKYRNGAAKIIIMGDFNCTPADRIMSFFERSENSAMNMINLSALQQAGTGTYRYQGLWEMIDQAIVSSAMLDCERGLFIKADGLKIVREGFLLYSDPSYPGLSPRPTYKGYKYMGGSSDHLPIVLEINVK